MNKIKILKIVPCQNSIFVEPKSIFYIQDGVEKKWDFIKTHDSVSVLLYHEERDSFLLVKQFRPAIFIHEDNDGFTYELCAGILDKNKSELEIIKEEIDEECGYDVSLEKIKKISSFYSSVGVTGARHALFFATINESMKVHSGGGIHDENIELIFIEKKDAETFIFDESYPKTPTVCFAITWFLNNKSLS